MTRSRKILQNSWVLSLIFVGCSHFAPLSVSTSHLDPDREIALGYVEGTAVTSYFLDFQMTDPEEGMQTAVDRAKAQADADNLINIFIDRRVTHYPFSILPIYTRVETIVRGTAIRYKDRSLGQLKDFTNKDQPAPAIHYQREPPKEQPKSTDGIN